MASYNFLKAGIFQKVQRWQESASQCDIGELDLIQPNPPSAVVQCLLDGQAAVVGRESGSAQETPDQLGLVDSSVQVMEGRGESQ